MRRLLWVLVLGCSCNGVVYYNYSTLPDPTSQPYRVQTGDVVNLRVARDQEFTGRYLVRPDGNITVPVIGEISVRNMTVDEVRNKIVPLLEKMIENASKAVSVQVEEVRSIRYSVIGEVQRAGMFDTNRHVTVLEALANAGGLTPYAKPNSLYVLRKEESRQIRIPISYTETINNPTGGRNFYLLSGDVIVVP